MNIKGAWDALWREKKAPTGVGADWWPYFSDSYRSRRSPNNYDLVYKHKNIAAYCAGINADAVSQVRLRLYTTRTARTKRKPNGKWFYQDTKVVDDNRCEYFTKHPALAPILSNAIEIHELPDHPLIRLLNRPNDFFTRTQLVEHSIMSHDIMGDAFWYLSFNELGLPTEIWPLEAHRVIPIPDFVGSSVIDFYEYATRTTKCAMQPSEILHFRRIGLMDPYVKGFSCLRQTYENSDVADKLLAYEEAVLDNRARPDMLISPKDPIGPAEALRLERKLQEKFRGGGSGGIVVGESGLSYQAMVFPPSDLAALEIRKVSKEEMATAFGIPMSMLAAQNVNRATAEAGHYQHAKNAVLPRCLKFEEILNLRLCSYYNNSQYASDDKIFFAFDNPVPEDREVAMRESESRIKSGIVAINEERRKIGMPPTPGGESPLVIGNFIPLDLSRQMAQSVITRNSAPGAIGSGDNSSPNSTVPNKPSKPSEPASEEDNEGAIEPEV